MAVIFMFGHVNVSKNIWTYILSSLFGDVIKIYDNMNMTNSASNVKVPQLEGPQILGGK